MDGGEEISCGFVVACGDGAELFEFAEEIFDQVARFIEFAVEIVRCRGGFAAAGSRLICRRRQGWRTRHRHRRPCRRSAVGRHLRQQSVGADQIVRLSRRQQKRQRVAERVDQGVDFVLSPPRLRPIA